VTSKQPRIQHSNKIERKLRSDFVYFLTFVFKKMGLPEPTPMQRLFADILQKMPSRRMIMLAYRGFAKTTIINWFLVWELWNDPRKQQAIWGQNRDFAADSVGQMLGWVQNFEFLHKIAPLRDQQQSTFGFDTPAKPAHVRGASVNALSIGGGITGSRADTLVIDDPETTQNGYTQQRRENLDRAMSEATMVIKEGTGRVIVPGTPHFDRSLYTRLKAKGYRIFIFPMTVPPKEVADACWEHYPRQIRDMILSLPEGTPLDRFSEEEVQMRMSEGKVTYERQCLLNLYRSSGTDRPLDITRIILYDANTRGLPQTLEHAREPQYVADDMAEYSCADLGEKFYRPFKVAETVRPYEKRVVYVDPSGQGKDELVYVSGGASSGYLVVFKIEGLRGGVTKENLETIIDHAMSIKAEAIYWESNLNTGAEWCRAVLDEKYAPRFGRAALPQVIPVHQQANKEQRIVSTLDPIINSGRMVLTPEAIMTDFLSAQDKGIESYADYTLTAQISNFSPRERLPFDDRLDALAGIGQVLAAYLQITPIRHATDAEYERFKDYLEQPVLGPSETFDVPAESQPATSRYREMSTKLRGSIGKVA
jgi:hypothetical protein